MFRFITPLYYFVRKNSVQSFVVAALAGILLFTRLSHFEENVMFLGDQGRDASIVRNLATFENLPFIGAPSSIGQVYLGPFYYYLIAPFLPLFGWNPAGLAFGVSIISILSTICAIYIIRKTFGLRVALISSSLMIFSAALIDLSRFSWNPNLLPYFSFATLYFFWQWLKKPSTRNGILFGLLYGLSMQLHYLSVFLGLPFVIMFLFEMSQKSSNEKRLKLLKQLFLPIGVFGVTMSPLVIFDLRHSFLNSSQLFHLLTTGGLSGENTSYFTKLGETISGLFFNGVSLSLSPVLATVLFVILSFLTIKAAHRISSRFFTINAVAVLLYVIGFAYLGSPRLAHYYVPIYLSFYLVLAALPSLIGNKILKNIVTGSIIVLIIILNVPRYGFMIQTPNNQIQIAREFSDSFRSHIKTSGKIQLVTVPYTESHGHFRYFLELAGYDLIAEDSGEEADELFVMCFVECIPQDDPQWQIAAFSNKHVAEHWVVRNVTIYRIVHKSPDSTL